MVDSTTLVQICAEAMMASAREAIVCLDSQHSILLFNPGAEKLFGIAADMAAGEPLNRFIPDGLVELAPGEIVWCSNESSVELFGLHASGARFPVAVSATPLAFAGEKLLLLALRDLSAHKEAEAQLAILAHAVESTSEPICITDLEDHFTFVNRAFQQSYGYTGDEILGRKPDMLLARRNSPALLDEIIRESHMGGWHGEVWDVRKDGTEFPIFLSTSQIRDGSGRVIGLMGVAQDITGRKRSEQELAQARLKLESHAAELERTVSERTAELRESIAELEAFSYSISHDLRGPLRAINNFSGFVLEECGPALGTEGRELMSKVINAAARMDRLLLDVLAFSRVSRRELRTENVEVEGLLEGLIGERPEFQVPQAQITIVAPLPAVRGDRASLTQCFTNLLDNAVKFVAPGIQPCVRICSEPAVQSVRFWIEDNGIGIAPEGHQKIFEIFQRQHVPPQYPGTGVGLAIVRKATERMGGRVGVESEPGNGSRFWLELPRAS